MAGSGNSQIINGRSYEQYTPDWYAARDVNAVDQAGVKGEAFGTFGAKAIDALSPALRGLYDATSMTSNSGAPSGGGGVSSTPLQIAPVDFSNANANEFARAKDQVGQETSGALTGLRSALAGRGLLGSGAESKGTASVITKGQAQLGDVSRQQAITGAESEQKNAEANLTAGVAQRGQDVVREGNQLRAQAEQANMQFQQRQSVLSGIMSALSGAMRSY